VRHQLHSDNDQPISLHSAGYTDGCIRKPKVYDKGRLQSVPMEVEDIDEATATVRQEIEIAIASKNALNRFQAVENSSEIQLRPWQVAAAAEVLCGRDVYVITATGTGKTMCFLLTLFTRSGIVVVVSPLLAMMEDQVHSATRLGISAVQISEQTLQDIPHLLDRISNGEFRLVFMQPEFCQPSNPSWRKLTLGRTKFAQGVYCVVIDEAHLIHQWTTFRTSYGHLSVLRHTFQQAVYMLCSAMMTSYTRRFVHRTLQLGPKVPFIHRSIDRPNVFIAVKKISQGTKDHRELYYLVPKGIRHPAEIPQTIVFLDSRPDAKLACDEFWELIPREWMARGEFRFVFAECSSVLSTKRRWMVMNAFRTGLCRVLFATEVAGMGIDFPYIERVVQWRVGPHLNISAILQRLGLFQRSSHPGSLHLVPHEPLHHQSSIRTVDIPNRSASNR